jgi:DNA-3-methyladenine glycosylase I
MPDPVIGSDPVIGPDSVIEPDLVIGDDGLARCRWGASTPDYAAYHDQEWGRPVRGERALFERFTLEAFQSGLSWLTILRKREGFRAAFADFDPEVVAAFGPTEVDRLLGDVGIVRNRAKIAATITNAAAVVALRQSWDGGLDALVWSFAEPEPTIGASRAASPSGPRSTAEVPASTPVSQALARELKRHGLIFVGPTTAYAAMQACGLVNDHVIGCHAREFAAR